MKGSENMEEKKIPTIVVVLLTIVGTCLVGFGVWYGINYFKGGDKPSAPDTPVEQPSSSITSPAGGKIDFPQKSDDNVLIGGFFDLLTENELITNFKNLQKQNSGNTFVYNCEKYVKSEEPINGSDYVCGEVKLTLNNELSINATVPYGVCGINKGCLKTIDIYKFNNYYVVVRYGGGGLDMNTIQIYNKSTEEYNTQATVITQYWLDENGTDVFYVKPAIVNDILHFVKGNGSEKLNYNTIDLSKDKIEVKLLKEFTGHISSEK